MDVDALIAEREATHGSFDDNSRVAQGLKTVLRGSHNWLKLSARKRQAIESIQDKVARIVSGDPDFGDHWRDIRGYSYLGESE